VPSPDWCDQIVCFMLTDRFADGDLKNNDQDVGADPVAIQRERPAPRRSRRQARAFTSRPGTTTAATTRSRATRQLSRGGSGDAARDPKVTDASAVIRLP
jgi:hypothetical protein